MRPSDDHNKSYELIYGIVKSANISLVTMGELEQTITEMHKHICDVEEKVVYLESKLKRTKL